MWWWVGKDKVKGEGTGTTTRRSMTHLSWEGFVGLDVNSHVFALEKLPKRVYSKAWEGPFLRNHKNKLKFKCHVMEPVLQKWSE